MRPRLMVVRCHSKCCRCFCMINRRNPKLHACLLTHCMSPIPQSPHEQFSAILHQILAECVLTIDASLPNSGRRSVFICFLSEQLGASIAVVHWTRVTWEWCTAHVLFLSVVLQNPGLTAFRLFQVRSMTLQREVCNMLRIGLITCKYSLDLLRIKWGGQYQSCGFMLA